MLVFLEMDLKRILVLGLLGLVGYTSIYESGIKICFDREAYDKVITPYVQASKIKYKIEDLKQDYWQTPAETEMLGTGDCEDMALYLQELWKRKGLESRVILGYYSMGFDPINKFKHAWNKITWKDKKYIFDSANEVVFETGNRRYKDYTEELDNEGEAFYRKKIEEYYIRANLTNNNFGVLFKITGRD